MRLSPFRWPTIGFKIQVSTWFSISGLRIHILVAFRGVGGFGCICFKGIRVLLYRLEGPCQGSFKGFGILGLRLEGLRFQGLGVYKI